MNRFSREEMLLGKDALARLKDAHVALFGLGGVGGYVAEALARCGVGALTLIDGDRISLTNINRQILALTRTIGMPKAEAAKSRILEINPECRVTALELFVGRDNIDRFDFTQYDYVIDAIDSVTAKLIIIESAKAAGTRVISCMGTGNKLDPMAFICADISETSVCPLARVMRRELKKRGIADVKVVYSREEARKPLQGGETELKGFSVDEGGVPANARPAPGSVAFVPAAAGLLIAGEVIKELIGG